MVHEGHAAMGEDARSRPACEIVPLARSAGSLLMAAVLLIGGAGMLAAEPLADRLPAPSRPAVPAAEPHKAEESPAAPAAEALTPPRPRRPVVPERPSDPASAKVHAILEAGCARCHQTGLLKAPRAGGDLANLLDLEAVGADPSLVRPGEPDGSRLYEVLVRRHWPLLSAREGGWPTPDEIAAVRTWIAERQRDEAPGCANRPPVGGPEIAGTIAAAIAAADAADRPHLRFLSLANLYSACASEEHIEGYRLGATRVLNSLSWAPAPGRLKPIGPAGTILQLDLRAFGWVAGHWKRIAAVYPYAAEPGFEIAAETVQVLGTGLPVVRADWLAAVALSPPLYYELLGLPQRFSDLEPMLDFNARNLIARTAAMRAGVVRSQVVRGARILERLPAGTGSIWRSYDLSGERPRQNILQHPVGPVSPSPTIDPFTFDSSRTLFSAPNGFPLFALYSPDGDLAAETPAAVEAQPSPFGAMRAGIDCLACHAAGPIGGRDELRPRIEASPQTYSNEARQAVLALHPEQGALDRAVAEDRARIATALAAAGTPEGVLVDGLEPVTALARTWRRGGGSALAASEAQLTEPELSQRISRLDGAARALGERLRHGTLARAELDHLIALLAPDRFLHKPPTPAGPAAAIDLAIWPDRATYRSGETLTLTALAGKDCQLTVVSIDRKGVGTVLFPNDFDTEQLIRAGQPMVLPPRGAPYQLRLKDPGREIVIAYCTTRAKNLIGIEHDFERQRFTVLGNWTAFERARLEQEMDAQSARRAKPDRTGARVPRRSRDARSQASEPETQGQGEAHGRAVATFEVR
jgi:cytochrome c5